MNIKDIVIVGGGSAGWMTAAILIKSFPEKNISVIESKNIPKIGVGESTYDGINFYFEYLEIDKDSFFVETDASIKLGLEFDDFYEKGDENFFYPFGRPDIEGTYWGMQDWLIKKYCYPKTPNSEFAESYYPVASLIKNNTFHENKDGVLPNFDPRIHTALHFDAQKFSLWLKDKYCLPRGVNHIVAEVDFVDVIDNNINFLLLNDKRKICADLFVDCTGFKSLLLDKTLKEPFINYNDILPNNRAWATRIPYIDQEKELETTTRCTAINNGWVWNIPLYSRLGSGYVYSDKFISPEGALEEFKQHLLSKKMKVARSLEDIEKLEFSDIKMRVGIHERLWVNNVVAIGLSAGFIEPLESNGLFTVHEFLFELVRALQKEKVSSWDIKVFNEKTRNGYESFLEFIKLHYALSIRDDTEYWRNNLHSSYSFDRLKNHRFDSSLLYRAFQQKTQTHEPITSGGFLTGFSCIAAGMNYQILDKVSARQGEIYYNISYKNFLKKQFDLLNNKKNVWDSVAKNSPSMYKYLTKKYYGDKNEKQ